MGGHSLGPSWALKGPIFGPSWVYAGPNLGPIMGLWDWFTPEFDWFTPEFDWFTPEFDWFTPEFDWFTPEFDWFTPEFDWLTPEFDWSTPEFDVNKINDMRAYLDRRINQHKSRYTFRMPDLTKANNQTSQHSFSCSKETGSRSASRSTR
jgi:hypothetical protein